MMRIRGSLRWATFLVAALGVLAFWQVNPSRADIKSTVDYSSSIDDNIEAQNVIEKYSANLDSDPTYGGLAILPAGISVGVIGESSSELATAIVGMSETVPVATKQVKNSWASLQAVSDSIAAEKPVLEKLGVFLSGWGPRASSNKLEVAIYKYTPEAASVLIDRYGADVVHVSEETEDYAPATRYTDTSPFRGANAIKPIGPIGTYDGPCTTWFGVKSATSVAQYVMTAGHCTPNDWRVYNGGALGSVVTRHWGGKVDAETFHVYSQNTIWSDPTSTFRSVSGVSTSNAEGGLICTNGAETGEVCNVEMQDVSYDKDYGGGLIMDMVKARQRNGTAAFTDGNSGGPVYTSLGSNGLNARGMIAAFNINDAAQGLFTKVANIESAFNVDVLVAP